MTALSGSGNAYNNVISGNNFANDYKATGALFYDDNGNGAGQAVMFAVLSTRPAMAANDFQII